MTSRCLIAGTIELEDVNALEEDAECVNWVASVWLLLLLELEPGF